MRIFGMKFSTMLRGLTSSFIITKKIVKNSSGELDIDLTSKTKSQLANWRIVLNDELRAWQVNGMELMETNIFLVMLGLHAFEFEFE